MHLGQLHLISIVASTGNSSRSAAFVSERRSASLVIVEGLETVLFDQPVTLRSGIV